MAVDCARALASDSARAVRNRKLRGVQLIAHLQVGLQQLSLAEFIDVG